MPSPDWLSNLNIINKLSFSFGYLVPSLDVQAWSFLQKLVCLPWKFVLFCCKCLAFVVVYVDVKHSVWYEALVLWVPLLVTCHSLLHHLVLSYTRGEILVVSPLLLFPPSLLWAEYIKICLQKALFDHWIVGDRVEHEPVLCNLICRNDRTTQMWILFHCLRH